jgi:hypothetical protein
VGQKPDPEIQEAALGVDVLPGKNDVREPLKKGGATERMGLEWQCQTRMAGSGEWRSFSGMEVWVA